MLDVQELNMLRQHFTILIFLLLGWQYSSTDAPHNIAAKPLKRHDYRRPNDIPYPSENPYSAAKSELGRSLFFDPIMSGSSNISCSTCHNPRLSWGDGLPRAIGAAKTPLAFRAPTLFNVAWQALLGWEGKFKSLEAVTFGPITAKGNMNMTEEGLIDKLKAEPEYVQRFAAAFEDGTISRTNIESALATYERSIVSGEAPFDKWVRGDDEAIDAAAQRGFEVFNTKARCAECHSGWAFTDGSFHDIGTAKGEDIGRARYVGNSIKLRYAFKTPTLRDVAKRAPYMHDGSVPALEEVIELYDKGGIERPSRSDSIKPIGLSKSEKADLLAFLGTLSAN